MVPTITGDAWQTTQLFRDDAPPELFNEDGEFTFAILGYNEQGQNLFARLGKATQTSLTIGLAAVILIVFIGVVIGSIAGYLGGWADNLLMRFVDIMLSLPGLFIILMITAFFGQGNVWVVIIAIGLTGWTTAARLVRAEFLSLREVDYVQAARALGASPQRIILRHMLPPALAPDRGGRDARHRRFGGRRVGAQLPRLRHRSRQRQPGHHAPERARLLLQRAAQGRCIPAWC